MADPCAAGEPDQQGWHRHRQRDDGPCQAGQQVKKARVQFAQQRSVTKFEAASVRAADAIEFHLLKGATRGALEAEVAAGGRPFRCEFWLQVFGDAEEITGYRGLRVDIWMATRGFHTLVEVAYEAATPDAVDVLAALRGWWPRGFSTDREEFIAAVCSTAAADFSTLGQPTGCITSRDTFSLALRHVTLAEAPAWFMELHERLSPLLIFTIDGASFIDADDPKWEVLAAVMTLTDGSQHMVGFAAVYSFYSFPLSSRPRLAQVLVLPPLQGSGIGKALVAAAYELAAKRNAPDLTFEDPAPQLQRLREKLELDMCMQQPWLVEAAREALVAALAAEQRQQAAEQELARRAQAAIQQRLAASATTAAPEERGLGAPGDSAGGQQAGSSDGDVAGGLDSAGAASLLALPGPVQARMTSQLKIHRPQARLVWESLLFCLLLPEFGALQDAFVDAVSTRLEAAHAGLADKRGARKKLVQVQGKDDSWFVYKLPGRPASAPGGPGGALPDDDALLADGSVAVAGRHTITSASSEAIAERLEALLQERLLQLAQLKKACAVCKTL